MRAHRVLGFVLLASLAAACNPFHQPVQMSQDVNYNTRWHGTLTSPAYLAGAVQITGNASMAHLGQCGADQGVFGPTDQYRPVKIGKDGRGTASATIPMPTPTSGNYFVLLHASSGNRETVVACGNLAPPAP
jgi:hypothetical protein